jgi:hypothetical protein
MTQAYRAELGKTRQFTSQMMDKNTFLPQIMMINNVNKEISKFGSNNVETNLLKTSQA